MKPCRWLGACKKGYSKVECEPPLEWVPSEFDPHSSWNPRFCISRLTAWCWRCFSTFRVRLPGCDVHRIGDPLIRWSRNSARLTSICFLVGFIPFFIVGMKVLFSLFRDKTMVVDTLRVLSRDTGEEHWFVRNYERYTSRILLAWTRMCRKYFD